MWFLLGKKSVQKLENQRLGRQKNENPVFWVGVGGRGGVQGGRKRVCRILIGWNVEEGWELEVSDMGRRCVREG